ncbi:MAG: cache domain-containing protein [Planctomycetota bacterium]
MGARPHVAALSISTLPWAVGVYCAVLGAMLLVVPHQFADLWGPIASSKTTFVAIASLVGGVGLLATAVFSPSWRSIRRAHLVAGAALLVVAGSSLRATGLAAAAFHAALGLGTLLGAWWGAPPGDEDARTRPDAFAILIGVASSVFAGVALFSIVRHGSTAAIVAGVALVIAGIGFAATPFIRALHHRSLLHHGLLAFALLALAATWSLPRRSWIELTITIGFGLLVALLPRIRPWFHSHRPPQLRQRVALTLGLAAAAPLVAAITVASQREEAFVEQEELRREQLLAGQIAHETAEYVESYREAVRALAGKPQLLDVAPEQQHELLQSFAAAFPDVLVFALTDARGNITARSDDLPPFSLNDRQLFEAAKAAGTAAQTVVLLPTDPAPQIRLAAAVRDAALEFKGTVSVVMEPKHLQALLQRAWPGEKGRMYLVDDRGRVVLDPRPDGFATLADRATAPPVAAFLENPFAAGSGRFHYGSRVWYAAFTSLPHLSCGVIVERPADLVLAAAHAGRELAFGILLVAIALAAVLGLLTADRLCAPLDALTRAARRLTAGDATAQLPTSPVMEIESLSLAFGAMRESLLARTAERERAESALRASEERLRMLIEGVRDYAIFMTDRSGEILVWNAAADGVMGYRADQIVGQSFTKLYPAEAVTSGEPEQHSRPRATSTASRARAGACGTTGRASGPTP